MKKPSSTIDYASPSPAKRKVAPITLWFLGDFALFLGALAYMMIAYEEAGPYKDLPPNQELILDLWMFAVFALFISLLGWAARNWLRSRKSR